MGNELVVKMPDQIDIPKWNQYAIDAREMIKDLCVTNDEDEAKAIDIAKQVKMFMARVEQARKDHVSPFNEYTKRINAAFKPITADLEACESKIKQELLLWMNKKTEIRLAEIKKREAEFQKQVEDKKLEEDVFGSSDKIVEAPLPIIQQSGPSRGDIGTASAKSIWRWELTDIDKVPDKYFTLDEKRVNEDVRAGVRDIPGIRIYEDKTIAIR